MELSLVFTSSFVFLNVVFLKKFFFHILDMSPLSHTSFQTLSPITVASIWN